MSNEFGEQNRQVEAEGGGAPKSVQGETVGVKTADRSENIRLIRAQIASAKWGLLFSTLQTLGVLAIPFVIWILSNRAESIEAKRQSEADSVEAKRRREDSQTELFVRYMFELARETDTTRQQRMVRVLQAAPWSRDPWVDSAIDMLRRNEALVASAQAAQLSTGRGPNISRPPLPSIDSQLTTTRHELGRILDNTPRYTPSPITPITVSRDTLPPRTDTTTRVSAPTAFRAYLPKQTYHVTPIQTSDWIQIVGFNVYYRYVLYFGREQADFGTPCSNEVRVVGEWNWGWTADGIAVECLDSEWLRFDLSRLREWLRRPTKLNIRNREDAWGLHGNPRFRAPCILSELGSYNLIFQANERGVFLTRRTPVDAEDAWIFEPKNADLDVCQGGTVAKKVNPGYWPFKR